MTVYINIPPYGSSIIKSFWTSRGSGKKYEGDSMTSWYFEWKYKVHDKKKFYFCYKPEYLVRVLLASSGTEIYKTYYPI